MCVSVTPGARVDFTDTVLYAAEVVGPGGDTVHALGYQNRVQGSARGLRARLPAVLAGQTGNAMILPFPAKPGTMTAANVFDTGGCRDLLQDMADAVAPRPPLPRGVDRADAPRGRAAKVKVFQAAGIYTVVLAQDARDIPAALAQVPRVKRPALNPALFEAYARWYPGWTVALCCFDGRRAALADPLLWWYEPTEPDRLFLPALDCHTGDVPDLTAQVEVDHGSHRMAGGVPVACREPLPAAVTPYALPTLVGQRFGGQMPNGDFHCSTEAVARGVFTPDRVPPPAA